MSQQKYTVADIPVLEAEIYSYLAEFTYLYNRNKKLSNLRQHIDYYKKIVTALARYLQKSARNKRDGHNKAYAENETREIVETLPMTEILDIAKYPSKAKQAVEKYILPFFGRLSWSLCRPIRISPINVRLMIVLQMLIC